MWISVRLRKLNSGLSRLILDVGAGLKPAPTPWFDPRLFNQGRTMMYERPEFFVGWGTLSLINAGLAQSKGRSGLSWWVVSLFLGPIATFLIVVLKRLDASSE